jgi:sodium pump decarboxylase gamma subunit
LLDARTRVDTERSLTIVAWLAGWWNQVSGTVLQGVETTVVGMAFVFFTLGLVILSMVVLTRLPWLRVREPPQQAEPEAAQETAVVAEASPQDDELAQVAAIAVALLRSQRRLAVPRQGKSQRSTWRNYGRAHQLGL